GGVALPYDEVVNRPPRGGNTSRPPGATIRPLWLLTPPQTAPGSSPRRTTTRRTGASRAPGSAFVAAWRTVRVSGSSTSVRPHAKPTAGQAAHPLRFCACSLRHYWVVSSSRSPEREPAV